MISLLSEKFDQRLHVVGWLLHAAGATLVLSVMGGLLSLVFWPLDKQVFDLVSREEHLRRYLRGAQAARHEHQQLLAQNTAAETRARSLYQRIPQEPQEAEFLGQISGLAERVGLELVDYRPALPIDREQYSEIEVLISSRGSYASLCQFLGGLQALPRFTNMGRLSIVREPDAEAYSITMTLVLYFGLQQAPPAAQEVAQRG
jgi:Tfp pilus assembly protein PilO